MYSLGKSLGVWLSRSGRRHIAVAALAMVLMGVSTSESTGHGGMSSGERLDWQNHKFVVGANTSAPVLSVVSFTPSDGAFTYERSDPGISVTFSDEIDPATLHGATFTVRSVGGDEIRGSLTVNGAIVSFYPDSPLDEKGVQVSVAVKAGPTGLLSTSGGSLNLGHAWAFTVLPDLEVTILPAQVVEGVDLVEAKPAVVRVRAGWHADSPVEKIEARVALVYNEGAESERRYEKKSVVFYKDDMLAPREPRFRGNSANFYSRYGEVPIVWMPGLHVIRAVVEPVGQPDYFAKTFAGETTARVRRPTLGTASWFNEYKTFYLPMAGGGWVDGELRDIAQTALQSDQMVRDLFPVRTTAPTISNVVTDVESDLGRLDPAYVFNTFLTLGRMTWFADYERVVAVSSAAWMDQTMDVWGNTLDLSVFRANSAIVDERAWPGVAAHELGHTHWVDHQGGALRGYDLRRDRIVANIGDCRTSDGMPGYMAGLMYFAIGDLTVDPKCAARPYNVWIHTPTYQKLLSRFTHQVFSFDSLAQPSGAVGVTGLIRRDGTSETAELNAVAILNARDATEPDPAGTYSIELLNDAGAVLGRHPFEPTFVTVDGVQHGIVSVSAPFDPSASQLVLKHVDRALATVERSHSAPTVDVVSPTALQQVAGPVGIQWQAEDSDGDDLAFQVLFSRDDGRSWDLLGLDRTERFMVIDSARLSSCEQCRVKVVANDGFNSSEAVSGRFSVDNPPSIKGAIPPDGSSEADPYSPLTILFRDAMDAATISGDTIRLTSDDGDDIPGHVSYDAITREAEFRPVVPLDFSATYRAAVSADVRNEMGGHLAGDFRWTFSTRGDDQPPSVVRVEPGLADLGVSPVAAVRVRFDEPIDSATIGPATLRIAQGVRLVDGSVSLSRTGLEATFRPASALKLGAVYSAVAAAGISDVEGNGMARDYRWSFETARVHSAFLPLSCKRVAMDALPTPDSSTPKPTTDIRTRVAATLTAAAPAATHTPNNATAVAATLTAIAQSTPTPTSTHTASATTVPNSPTPTQEPSPTATRPVPSPTDTVPPTLPGPQPTATFEPTPTPTFTATTEPTPWPPGEGVYGRVWDGGTPAASVSLTLIEWDGTNQATRATTTTRSDGNYHFTGVPALRPTSSYLVVYGLNTTDPSRLKSWVGRTLNTYDGRGPERGGDFDLANVALVAPPDGAAVKLPTSFQWARRGVQGDSYKLELKSVQSGTEYTTNPLGDAGSVSVPSLPAGFEYGVPHDWYVYVESGDNGVGVSFGSRRITIARTLPFEDDFCYPTSGWPTMDDAISRMGYLSGPPCQYMIHVKASDSFSWAHPDVEVTDFVVEVSVHAAGSGAAGILFGMSDDDLDYKVFMIASDGTYALLHNNHGNWHEIIDDTPSSLVDLDVWNDLRLAVVGDMAELSIAGQRLQSVQMCSSGAGYVGLYAESWPPDFDARFRSFKLYGIGSVLGAVRPSRSTGRSDAAQLLKRNMALSRLPVARP